MTFGGGVSSEGSWEISHGAAVPPNRTAHNGKARRPTGPEVS
jgi:hypothetical protein